MARGTEAVTQKGVKGKTVYTYELKSIDGGKPTSTLVDTKTTDPVTKITSYGTHVSAPSLSSLSQSRDYITNIDDEKDTLQRSPATHYTVRKKMTCSATAYTARPGSGTCYRQKGQSWCDCCRSQGHSLWDLDVYPDLFRLCAIRYRRCRRLRRCCQRQHH